MADPTADRGGRLAATALAAVACLLMGFAVAYTWLRPSDVPPAPSLSNSDATGGVTPAHSTVDRPSPAPAGTTRPDTSTQATAGPAAQTGPESQRCAVNVTFATADGQTVPGVAVNVNVFSATPEADGKHYSLAAPLFSDRSGQILLSNEAGRRLTLEVTDAAWYAAPLETDFVPGQSEVEVLLESVCTVRVRAQYDDGVPVTYMGSLRSAGRSGYSVSFALDEQGCAEVARVPVRPLLRCIIFGGKRTGYAKHEVSLRQDQLTSGMENLIVVPRTVAAGGLLVLFQNGVIAPRSCIVLECSQDWPPAESRQLPSGAQRYEWPNLTPGRRYRLMVVGTLCWRSDWIEVAEGQVTTVSARLDPCGTVTARIVDEQGQPIELGALALSNGMAYTFTASKAAGPLTGGISGPDGQAVLKGLPPGPVALEAVAWGTEPVTLNVDVIAGQTTDLGTLILRKARGTIRVTLTGVPAGQRFRVSISPAQPPSAPDVLPPEIAVDGRLVMECLPLREYQVAAFPSDGGGVVTTRVELSAAEFDREVVLDVSSLVRGK